MTDPEARAIMHKIALSTQSLEYMVAQMSQFIAHNPTYTRRVLYNWIKEVNPVLAEKLASAAYGYQGR